jgi:hypothetical protein
MSGLGPVRFRTAALVAVAAILVVTAVAPPITPERPARGGSAPISRLATDTSPSQGRREAVPAGRANGWAAAERGAGMRVARRFVRYYLAWERAHTSPSIRAGISASASRELARLVLTAPPRQPPAVAPPPPPARFLGLRGELALSRRRLHVQVELARGRQRWAIGLVLRRSRQQWLVASVRD